MSKINFDTKATSEGLEISKYTIYYCLLLEFPDFQKLFKQFSKELRDVLGSKVMWYNTNRSVVARGSARP